MDESNPPDVTVYVPCRNYGRFLGNALDSLLAQLYPHWEAIVIDEASVDDTSEIATRYAAQDTRIRTLRNDAPMGLQKVANRVLGMARGKYIVRLDADDWLDESALLVMAAKLDSDQSLGLVYGNYYYTNENGEVLGIERRHKLGTEDRAGHLPPHGACTMVRTRALKAVGGYSENIDAQDGWELWYKLASRTKAASLDAPLFYYRQHNTSLSRDSARLLRARSKIFSALEQGVGGDYKPCVLAVIGVRESYPGFDGVPFRKAGSSTLLDHALQAACAADGVTAVMVSSQSQSVLDAAAGSNIVQASRVPVDLVRRETPDDDEVFRLEDVIRHAGEAFQSFSNRTPDIVVFLSIHAPLRRAQHIQQALQILRISQSDSAVSVVEERDPVFQYSEHGLSVLNSGRFRNLSHDREKLFRFNGAVLANWWDVVESGRLIGDKVAYIEMGLDESVQIKRPEDLRFFD